MRFVCSSPTEVGIPGRHMQTRTRCPGSGMCSTQTNLLPVQICQVGSSSLALSPEVTVGLMWQAECSRCQLKEVRSLPWKEQEAFFFPKQGGKQDMNTASTVLFKFCLKKQDSTVFILHEGGILLWALGGNWRPISGGICGFTLRQQWAFLWCLFLSIATYLPTYLSSICRL